MILFVFEGEKREPTLFRTMLHLFFPQIKDKILCSYKNNIYNLYRKINETDESQDIVSVLRQKWQGEPDNLFKDIYTTSDISEIYLFFDYDCQNQTKGKELTLQQLNQQMEELLSFFDDETGNGKLYVNYPMIESIRYTKLLPDKNYNSYTIPISECINFKQRAAEFSAYPNLDFISFKYDNKKNSLKIPNNEQCETIKQNWQYLKEQNVRKALLLTTGSKQIPQKKELISQHDIFSSQIRKYIKVDNSVSVLNSLPLFLYEYF